MKNRILSLILLGAMLLSVTACDGDEDKNPDGSNTSATDTTASSETAPAGIEAKEYGGTTNILKFNAGLYTKYFDPGDDMTDIMNKALYNREIKVEDHLGVNITYENAAGGYALYDVLHTAIASNDDLYQMVLTHGRVDVPKLITEGCLVDMNNLGIDFSAEWFNQEVNEVLEVDGKQFYALCDYMLLDPIAVLFNRDMIENHHLEDPYQLVRDGKWTIDKMAEMASGVALDNGDTVWDEADIYGFSTTRSEYLTAFITAADVQIIGKNADGEFELAFDSDRAYTLMDKLDNLLNEQNTLTWHEKWEDPAWGTNVPFGEGRSLFTLFYLNFLHTLRGIDVDYGILPYPKLDEEQEDYYSMNFSGLLGVPFSVKEESYEMVGDVIELLSYYSEEEVIPTYIEITLGTKLARDETTQEMLDIIFDGVRFEPARQYFGDSTTMEATYALQFTPDMMLVETGENTFASWLATYSTPAKAIIDDFNEAVRNVEG